MRLRIMRHYALSFFIACLFIVVVNVFYMRSYVYKEADLYHFDQTKWMSQIGQDIDTNGFEELDISDVLKDTLLEAGIGVQIIDEGLSEVFRFNVPAGVEAKYTAAGVASLYENKTFTVFVEGNTRGEKPYTVFMFMDPAKVKRTLYTYDVGQVGAAYNIYWLIGMNVALLLMLSYMYTYSVSRPIHRMIERIVSLSEGKYGARDTGKGIYASVEVAMNQLGVQLENARLEREQADSTREEWISNLSHDIKTPLTSIMGYGELVGETQYPLTDEERLHYKQVILDKGAYIETLLSDLNLATRLKHHQMALRYEVVNLVPEVKNCLIDVLNSAEVMASEHAVAFTHTDEPVWVTLDRHLFKRMLLNLVHNSFVHNEAPVTVNVDVHVDASDAQWVWIAIDDNGVGVLENDLKHIFTRYYRGTHTRTKSEGSGLGMAIAKDIIEAHHGVISAEKGPRGGLKITIKLRRATQHETLS